MILTSHNLFSRPFFDNKIIMMELEFVFGSRNCPERIFLNRVICVFFFLFVILNIFFDRVKDKIIVDNPSGICYSTGLLCSTYGTVKQTNKQNGWRKGKTILLANTNLYRLATSWLREHRRCEGCSQSDQNNASNEVVRCVWVMTRKRLWESLKFVLLTLSQAVYQFTNSCRYDCSYYYSCSPQTKTFGIKPNSSVHPLASLQTSFGVRSSRIHFSPTEGERNAWRTNPKGRLRGGYTPSHSVLNSCSSSCGV